MDLVLPIARKPLSGTVSLPGDKSLAHRAALFGAIAEGRSVVSNYPDSGVTRAMRRSLESLGVPSTLENGVLTIDGRGYKAFKRGVVADCGNSGTTMRLLAGVLAGTRTVATLDGSQGLRKRPMARIADPLRLMGAGIKLAEGAVAPIEFCDAGKKLSAIEYALPVASAQVKSCLILAALGAEGESRFSEPGPSRDHTERMLSSMGAKIESSGNCVSVKPLEHALSPLSGALPGDISSAAFLFTAAAIVPGGSVCVSGLGVNETRTGILDVLEMMGARVRLSNPRIVFGESVADATIAAPDALRAVEIDGDLVVRAIDEFPAISVLAAFARGRTIVRGAKELRYKESDRIAAICRNLSALGASVEEFEDGFAIEGGTISGGTAEAGGDHRLAMSMAIAGLVKPVMVRGAEILSESFPDFTAILEKLGVN